MTFTTEDKDDKRSRADGAECTPVEWDAEERQLLDEATYDPIADAYLGQKYI